MPLTKAKKQIQLFGGMADDTDDFLIQSPAVEYAENCHWRGKDGALTKRLGSTAATATGQPSETYAPTSLHAIGDKLHTFTNTTAYSYDETADDWDAVSSVPYYTENTLVANSPTLNGTTCQTVHRTTTGETILAYTIKEKPSHYAGEPGIFSSYVQVTGSDGAPKIVPAGSGTYNVIYADCGGGTATALYRRSISLTTGSLGSATAIVSDVYSGGARQFGTDDAFTFNGMTLYGGSTAGYPWYEVTNMQDVNDYNGINLRLAYTNGTTGDLTTFESDNGFASNVNSITISKFTSTYQRPLGICRDGLNHYLLAVLVDDSITDIDSTAGGCQCGHVERVLNITGTRCRRPRCLRSSRPVLPSGHSVVKFITAQYGHVYIPPAGMDKVVPAYFRQITITTEDNYL